MRMIEDNEKQFNGLACLWMAAAILFGVGLALTLSGWIFEKAPSDLRRTSVLLEALADPSIQPSYVVLGNSVVMSGIDTRLLSERIPGNPLGLNLATTGQNPVDSYLYYQNLPDDLQLVVQFTLPRFAANRDSIEPQKFNAMYMYGYRPDPTTQIRLGDIFGDETLAILQRSELRQRFESRWAIQQTADNFVRSLVRKDLKFETYTFDLYFPNSGAKRIPESQMERALNMRYNVSAHGYPYTAEKSAFFVEAARRVKDSGKDFALVISPLHPSVHQRSGEQWYSEVREFFYGLSRNGNFAVIDAMDAVPEEHFVDALHLSEAGAKVLTEFVAKEIRRLNLEPES